MNTDTGRVYRGLDEIMAAEARGEPIARVSEHVATAVEIGNRAIRAARAYVKKTPETEADHAAVATAQAKRDRRAARNLSLGAER